MHLRSDSFRPYDYLAERLAFAAHDPDTHVRLAGNRNPHLAWSGVPAGTRSFALTCHDPEVPTDGTQVNQEGRSVPLDLPRADFFHWVVADLPSALRHIAEGSHSHGVTPRGKALGPSASGGVQGVNDYTSWYASDPDMQGDYGGYDGPCPPWNDERVHGYFFTLFALDIDRTGLHGAFTGHDLRAAIAGHVLERATITGLYTIDPARRQER